MAQGELGVCDRWLNSFEAFLEDMGRRPSENHSLDRYPNKYGNYEPSNCRWATIIQQANNTTRNRLIEFNGKTQTMTEWIRELELKRSTVIDRLNNGRPLSVVFSRMDKTLFKNPFNRLGRIKEGVLKRVLL